MTNHSKPSRFLFLLRVLAFEVVVAVVIYLPIDQWIMDARGASYAELMGYFAKIFILIVLYMVVFGLQIKGGRSRSYHSNPGSSGLGGGQWRGPPL